MKTVIVTTEVTEENPGEVVRVLVDVVSKVSDEGVQRTRTTQSWTANRTSLV